MDTFIQNLKEQLSKGLPGDEAHQLLTPSKRLQARNIIASQKEYRLSAVGILIYPKKNRFYSLLIQRSTYNGSHSGQISFPGGKKEDTDKDLEHTARRECFEEVHFPLDDGEFIGELSEVYIPVSNFMVKPFIFYSSKELHFKCNEREVEHLIEFDLKNQLINNPQQIGTIQVMKGVRQKNVPYFSIEGKIVWGATAMILSELKEILKAIKI